MPFSAVIYDCDGMINHEERFSDRFSAEVPLERLIPFFKGEFQQCLVGSADLREVLAKKILEWGWHGSVEELLAIWFSDGANRTDEVLAGEIARLRVRGIKAYLATNNERYRTEYLLTRRGYARLFDRVFASGLVGAKKPDAAFYDALFAAIPESREEVLYWDDDPAHIEAARAQGVRAELFTGTAEFIARMHALDSANASS